MTLTPHRPAPSPVATETRLEDRYTREDGTVYLTGITALVRMIADRTRLDHSLGLRTASFVSGYEGSPLAGLDLELDRRRAHLAPLNVVHRPGLNEELAATSVMGSQLAPGIGLRADSGIDGVVGYWYGKAPGLDRATDAIRHANLVGTHPDGGAVAIVGDDPGAKSSTVPSASEMALADLCIPTLYPADSQDILDLGVHAALMSRATGVWTALKISAHVADGASTAQVHPDRLRPESIGRSPHVPSGRLLGASLMELEQNQLTVRIPRALEYARRNRINRIVVSSPDDRIGIVAAGKTYLDVRNALRLFKIDDDDLHRLGIRILKLGMVYPLDPEIVHTFIGDTATGRGLREVIVVEEKRDFVETMLRDILFRHPGAPAIVGKVNENGSTLFSRFGELDVDAVTRGLAGRLADHHHVPAARDWLSNAARTRTRIELPLAVRTPYFCSGCPHNSSTRVADGTLVGAGIGCHAMVLLMDPRQVGDVVGTTQMGGEGAQWIGMAPFVSQDHFVQNIGDGTFAHSGSLALRAAVASGENITYKLLYNGTVAMTGGQEAVGGPGLAQLVSLLMSEGVSRVVVTSDDPRRTRRLLRDARPSGVRVRHRDELLTVHTELAAIPGVTVLIHDQQCAADKRRKRKRGQQDTPATRVMINERICEGCGDCGRQSNCLSVQPVDTEFGRKTRIDESSCNLDYSCLDGDCPAFVTVTPGTPERVGGDDIGPDLSVVIPPSLVEVPPSVEVPSSVEVPPSSVEVPPSVEVRGAQATSLETPHDDNVTSPGFEAPRPAARHTSTNGGNGPEDIRRGDGTTGTFSMRITGIGGTGVVTISQVIATAATLDGRSARTVDMTGLAQKGGAVVSDVKITPEPAEEAAKVAARTCDLYLVCDALVGTDPVNLTVTEAHRTTAVVSTTKMPTGAMVIDTKVGFPADAAVHSAIDEHVGRALYLDAVATSDALFGDEQFANMLLVGAAHETGALPVSAASIERAIALNGVAVDTNMQAFRRGRQSVADPDALAAALAIRVRHAETAPSTDAVRAVEAAGITDPAVGAVTRLRYDELAAYADSDYAREYLAVVARVDRSALGADVTEAVARHLYKLMAYKDEYEVARLTADPAFAATVAHTYGDDATTAVRLHPPTLRALGLRHKVGFGRWARPALTGLARMKRLRGTALDPFRYTEVRRTERELIGEYREVIGQVLAAWDDGRIGVDDRPAIIGLLSLPDMVRGYEHIKLDNVAQYRDTVRRTLADLIT